MSSSIYRSGTHRLTYRPGLDGARGISIILMIATHVSLTPWLPGIWVGLNMFFVLSGYLIVRLLLQEQTITGRISIRAFYLRRLRRLGPALILTLTALATYGYFFASETRKIGLRGDIYATLAYVMNWRLVLQSDDYFGNFTYPSFLRHAWTLSYEEQFYVVIPLLLTVCMVWIRKKQHWVWVFLALAGLSTWIGSTIDTSTVSGQARAYYSTDTRGVAIAIGAALAIYIAPKTRVETEKQFTPRLTALLGWGGFLGLILSYIYVQPFAPWVYGYGGLTALTVMIAAYVLACSDTRNSLLIKIHSLTPLAYTGKIAYSLYLYHWPIHLILREELPSLPDVVHVGLVFLLTYAAAAASYRLIEEPVMRFGLDGLPFRRTPPLLTALSSLALLLALTTSMGSGAIAAPQGGYGHTRSLANIPNIVPEQSHYLAPPKVTKVALFGDSLTHYLAQRYPADIFANLSIIDASAPGCDFLDEPRHWMPGLIQADDDPCRKNKKEWAEKASQEGADTVLIMPSALTIIPHPLPVATPNGSTTKVVWLGSPEESSRAAFTAAMRRQLDRRLSQARAAEISHVYVGTSPCRPDRVQDIPGPFRVALEKSPDIFAAIHTPTKFNEILRIWAAENHIQIVDFAQATCQKPFQEKISGMQIYEDGIHFSPEITPAIWKWLAPQLLNTSPDSSETSHPSRKP